MSVEKTVPSRITRIGGLRGTSGGVLRFGVSPEKMPVTSFGYVGLRGQMSRITTLLWVYVSR